MHGPETLLNALETAGCRMTTPRRAVARAIAARDGHFTAADLVSDATLRDQGIGRATVFRAIDLFAELGALERLELPDGDHVYVRCEPRNERPEHGDHHHHHLVCTRCGATAEMEACGMRRVIDEAEAQSGFRIEAHRIELFGLCPACVRRPA